MLAPKKTSVAFILVLLSVAGPGLRAEVVDQAIGSNDGEGDPTAVVTTTAALMVSNSTLSGNCCNSSIDCMIGESCERGGYEAGQCENSGFLGVCE